MECCWKIYLYIKFVFITLHSWNGTPYKHRANETRRFASAFRDLFRRISPFRKFEWHPKRLGNFFTAFYSCNIAVCFSENTICVGKSISTGGRCLSGPDAPHSSRGRLSQPLSPPLPSTSESLFSPGSFFAKTRRGGERPQWLKRRKGEASGRADDGRRRSWKMIKPRPGKIKPEKLLCHGVGNKFYSDVKVHFRAFTDRPLLPFLSGEIARATELLSTSRRMPFKHRRRDSLNYRLRNTFHLF